MTIFIIEMNAKKLGKRYYGYNTPFTKDKNDATSFSMRGDEDEVYKIINKYRSEGVDARLVEWNVKFIEVKKDYTDDLIKYNMI